ncbi:response regulator [Pedobacter suwonensis]|uniref:hypothetical protein n=1 Tax=Pedobacter suwonensis TaxID=332999 RepID=UPI0011A17837|nr:hypothetical protein [Pedobacter suwonensis]
MQTTILYIGRDTEITTVMNRLLNARPEWKGICVCSDDEAISICREQHIDLVLLGNGIDEGCEKVLMAKLTEIKPDVKIIQHYGGGSGLLYGEIMTAISQDF